MKRSEPGAWRRRGGPGVVVVPLLVFVASVAFLAALTPRLARAHEMRPSLLNLAERGSGDLVVDWRLSFAKGGPLPLTVHLNPPCPVAAPPEVRVQPPMKWSRWVWRCEGGLAGRRLSVGGLKRSGTDVIVKVSRAGVRGQQSLVLTAEAPELFFSPRPPRPSLSAPVSGAFVAYGWLGATHIFEGFDHLMFVLGLCLLVWKSRAGWRARGRALGGAVTGFTLGHSLTLGLASLGVAPMGGLAVEAVIALSVLFLFRELALDLNASGARGHEAAQWSSARRHPWVFAAVCGLLHGLGFAGALAEVGLPDGERVWALLGFNCGVELGQLIFIGAVVAVEALLRGAVDGLGERWRQWRVRLWEWAHIVLVMGVGIVSGVWLVGRLATMVWSP